MRVLLFSGNPFEASRENESSPSRSHYGKTKYGDKKLPAVVKNGLFKTVWKTVLFVTPYIREKRGCAGDIAPIPTTAWRAVHRQSGTAFYHLKTKKMAGTLPQFRMDFLRPIGSYFELYFVFLMSSGRRVGLFTGSPKGSQGNKRT